MIEAKKRRSREASQTVDEEEGKSTGVTEAYVEANQYPFGGDGCGQRRRSVRWIELGKMWRNFTNIQG